MKKHKQKPHDNPKTARIDPQLRDEYDRAITATVDYIMRRPQPLVLAAGGKAPAAGV